MPICLPFSCKSLPLSRRSLEGSLKNPLECCPLARNAGTSSFYFLLYGEVECINLSRIIADTRHGVSHFRIKQDMRHDPCK
ncbi:hypothetical protein HN011_002876 [Eciton burchellii]|nr:hypothetical protein HN011_002876 [Eciton burchellii]